MTTESKEIINFYGSEHEAILNRIDKEGLVKELINVDKSNAPETYATLHHIFRAIGQHTVDMTAYCKAQLVLKDCEMKRIRVRASLLVSLEENVTGSATCYLCFASENITNLKELVNGKVIHDAFILKIDIA